MRCLLFVMLAGACAVASAAQITVYNQGPAVVAQQRSVTLDAGTQPLAWPGLPTQLLASSLWLQGKGVRLVGTRKADDRLDTSALLRACIGKQVTLLRGDGQGGDVSRQATLLSVAGAPVVRVDGHNEVLDARSPWRIALPRLSPGTLLPGSTQLRVSADQAGERALTLIYQTGGLSWNTQYVGRYDDQHQRLALSARAELTNNTGASFDGAQVSLIAGQVNRARGGGPRPVMMRSYAKASAEDNVSAQKAFAYYRYRLPGTLSLADGEQAGVALFHDTDIAVKREYVISGGWQSRGDGTATTHPAIRVHFDNSLGKPLPAGTVRVYDSSDAPMLLGEDHLSHTPKGERVALTLGQAFDITGERRVTETTRHGSSNESARQITVRNAGNKTVKVRVVESLPGDWKLTSESLPHTKVNDSHAAWTLGVPAGGHAVLRYRVQWH